MYLNKCTFWHTHKYKESLKLSFGCLMYGLMPYPSTLLCNNIHNLLAYIYTIISIHSVVISALILNLIRNIHKNTNDLIDSLNTHRTVLSTNSLLLDVSGQMLNSIQTCRFSNTNKKFRDLKCVCLSIITSPNIDDDNTIRSLRTSISTA
jgi:hypothetical protein